MPKLEKEKQSLGSANDLNAVNYHAFVMSDTIHVDGKKSEERMEEDEDKQAIPDIIRSRVPKCGACGFSDQARLAKTQQLNHKTLQMPHATLIPCSSRWSTQITSIARRHRKTYCPTACTCVSQKTTVKLMRM